jgi:hypothetical protein
MRDIMRRTRTHLHITTCGGEERAVETLTHRHTHSRAHANNVERGKINKDGRKRGCWEERWGDLEEKKGLYIRKKDIAR